MEDVVPRAGELDHGGGQRDDELALAARSDPDAFGVLYERHRLAVFRYLRTRARTDDEAGELTAVTFERALVAVRRYRPKGGGYLAWLLRIARNAAIDAHRRTRPEALRPDAIDDAHASPETVALEQERRRSLLRAVNELPEVQREAIALRYAAGLTAREIGQVIGRSDGATQKILSRALATIRENHRVDR
jgi:RNA polymerase sigma-70 factor, ECF subfamily